MLASILSVIKLTDAMFCLKIIHLLLEKSMEYHWMPASTNNKLPELIPILIVQYEGETNNLSSIKESYVNQHTLMPRQQTPNLTPQITVNN